MGIKYNKNRKLIELLNQCTLKDKDAWNMFVDRYSRIIYYYIIRTLKNYNYSLKNDAVHEIFSRIFLALLEKNCYRLRNFKEANERSFIAYLREICFHISIDYLREQKKFLELDKSSSYSIDDFIINQLDREKIWEIMTKISKSLPDRHKFLFNLLYREGCQIREVADIMKLNTNAAHQLKFRMMNNIIKIAKEKDLYRDLELLAMATLV